MGGRFFQGEHFDEVFVYAEIAAMALEMRFAEVVVEESVVLELRRREFDRIKIQGPLQNGKRFLFSEDSRAYKVADVRPERLDLLAKNGFRTFELALLEPHARG